MPAELVDPHFVRQVKECVAEAEQKIRKIAALKSNGDDDEAINIYLNALWTLGMIGLRDVQSMGVPGYFVVQLSQNMLEAASDRDVATHLEKNPFTIIRGPHSG